MSEPSLVERIAALREELAQHEKRSHEIRVELQAAGESLRDGGVGIVVKRGSEAKDIARAVIARGGEVSSRDVTRALVEAGFSVTGAPFAASRTLRRMVASGLLVRLSKGYYAVATNGVAR